MSSDEMILLLKHFTERPQDLETIGEALNRLGTFRKAPPALAVFFDRALNYWQMYNSRITYEELALCFRDSGLDSSKDREILQHIRKWYEDGALSEPLSRERLKDLVNEAKMESVSSRISVRGEVPHGDIDEMTRWSEEIHKELTEDLVNSEKPWNPTDPENDPRNADTEADLRSKIPFGVDWIDIGQGGGARPGETTAVIAPTGGGKTTVGFQLANSLVNAGRYVAHLSLEQCFKGDLQRRIMVLATESSREDWEDIREVPQHLWDRWDAKKYLWRQYYAGYEHFLRNPDFELKSLRQAFDPMMEHISTQHDQWVKDGRPDTVNEPVLDTVIVDWYGELLQLWKQTHVYGRDSSAMRDAAMNLKKGLRDWAEYMNVRMVILHQAKGAEAKNRRLSVHDAQEDSNFGDRMNYCWGLSGYEEGEGLVWAHMSKGRDAPKMTIPLHLNGERCRFEMTDPDAGAVSLLRRRGSGGKGQKDRAGHKLDTYGHIG